MKKCNVCNIEYNEDMNFCTNCGNKLSEVSQNEFRKASKSDMKGVAIVFAIVLLLIFIGARQQAIRDNALKDVPDLNEILEEDFIGDNETSVENDVSNDKNTETDKDLANNDTTHIEEVTFSDIDERLIKNFKSALKEAKMDFSKVKNIYKPIEWNNGLRYQFSYDEGLVPNVYYIYAYEDGQIVSITTGTKDVYRNDNIIIENNDAEAITLTYNQLGEYGKYVKFDGKKYMRYVLPAGKYEVSALIKNSMFFIEKTKIYKNSFGHDETQTVSTVQLTDVGSTKTITLKKDEWINLTMNSSISIKKVK